MEFYNSEHSYHFSIPSGGLFDHLITQPYYDENQAAYYIHQLVDVTHYLHNAKIAHLDIKVRLWTVNVNG